MRGHANLIPTTEPVVFRLTEDEKAELRYFVHKAQRVGDYTQSDLCRVAVTRFLRAARNGGRKWLIEQINKEKEARPSDGEAGGLNREKRCLLVNDARDSVGADADPGIAIFEARR